MGAVRGGRRAPVGVGVGVGVRERRRAGRSMMESQRVRALRKGGRLQGGISRMGTRTGRARDGS